MNSQSFGIQLVVLVSITFLQLCSRILLHLCFFIFFVRVCVNFFIIIVQMVSIANVVILVNCQYLGIEMPKAFYTDHFLVKLH